MDTTLPSSDRPISIAGPRLPAVILFDVNETLSDMSPIAKRFLDIGAPAHLAATWFATLLRDGFALTAAGSTAPFAQLGVGVLQCQPSRPAPRPHRRRSDRTHHGRLR